MKEILSNPKFKGALFRTLTAVRFANQLHFNETSSLVCKEIFLTIPVVLYFPKNFFLTEAINKKIALLQAAGLIDYWHSQIFDERKLKIIEDKQPRAMKFQYLSGCFYIWSICCCFACLAFVVEVFARMRHSLQDKRRSSLFM